jgi:ATP-dependent Clp protease adapter protein ClpS
MPTLSESLERSVQRATAIAGAARQERATLEHLLLALTDDAEAVAVLRAGDVDLERLRRTLTALVDSDPAQCESGRSEDAKPSADFQRVVQRAVIHVQSTTQRQQVTTTDVLVEILAERGSQAAAALEQQGVTRYDATLYICHGIGKADRLSSRGTEAAPPDRSGAPPPQAKVLLLNDDYTPMAFVVDVLECVFEKDHDTAVRIMFETHDRGTGTCGLFPYDIASSKVSEVLELAREQQHPLQCMLEPSGSI